MEIRGKAPRGRENQNHWNTDKLERGESLEGWIAGLPVCVTVHEAPVTRVCLKRYTGFDVPCPGCASRLKVVDVMYQPLYRGILLTPCVVPLRESQKNAIAMLNIHDTVVVSRPKAKNCGRQIEKRPKQMAFPGGKEHQMPRCCAEWLPTLWGYSDRITGEQLLRGPVFDVAEAERCAAKPVKSPTDDDNAEWRRAALESAKRRKSRSEAIGIGDVQNGLLNGVHRVERNGDHSE